MSFQLMYSVVPTLPSFLLTSLRFQLVALALQSPLAVLLVAHAQKRRVYVSFQGLPGTLRLEVRTLRC